MGLPCGCCLVLLVYLSPDVLSLCGQPLMAYLMNKFLLEFDDVHSKLQCSCGLHVGTSLVHLSFIYVLGFVVSVIVAGMK